MPAGKVLHVSISGASIETRGPAGDRYRGDARQTPRARHAPPRAGLRRAIHRYPEPGRATPLFWL